jgi:hypothetical protein
MENDMKRPSSRWEQPVRKDVTQKEGRKWEVTGRVLRRQTDEEVSWVERVT